MGLVSLLLLVATIVTTSNGSTLDHPRLRIQHLRPQTGSSSDDVPVVSCSSWRFGVETNNIRGWKTVPKKCADHVRDYVEGAQYQEDSKAVVAEAIRYAESLNLVKDFKKFWVFDVDETALSNLPYFAKHGFGVEPLDLVSAGKWILEAKAKALTDTLELYKKLKPLGIETVFLTGRNATLYKKATAENLINAGYNDGWLDLILKDTHLSIGEFKSSKRRELEEKKGYKIVGNIGDQWSDISGNNIGDRTFKLPNPMYYIPY